MVLDVTRRWRIGPMSPPRDERPPSDRLVPSAEDAADALPADPIAARAFIEALATPLPRRDVPGARPTWRQLVRIVGVAAVLLGLAAYWVARAPGAWRRRAADAVRSEAPPGKQP